MKTHSRRQFLNQTSQVATLTMLTPESLFKLLAKEAGFTIHIFSKHLQWLNYADMASKVKEMGFDGVDLTVRPGGHVAPDRVKEDLPKAVDLLKKAGLKVEMITTATQNVQSPFSEDIVKTASQLGISYYRMGWIPYDAKQSIEKNLKTIESQLKEIADLNKSYKIKGAYQNHAGKSFGAAVWDIWTVFKNINSPYLGSQYDLRHAMVEGLHAWENGFELVAPFINTLAVKDFHFKNQKDGEPVENVPLGEGIVIWDAFFKKLKEKKITVPISLHCEYPLGGADQGKQQIEISEAEVLNALKRDLGVLRGFI